MKHVALVLILALVGSPANAYEVDVCADDLRVRVTVVKGCEPTPTPTPTPEPTPTPTPRPTTLAIGINIAPPLYYSSPSFIDVLRKQTRWTTEIHWGQPVPDPMPAIPIDGLGYPTGLPENANAGMLINRNLPGRFWPATTYVLTWTGGALGTGCRFAGCKVASREPNRIVFTTAPGLDEYSGFNLFLSAIDPVSPPKAMQFVPLEYEGRVGRELGEPNIFYPAYVAHLKHYPAGLRMMPWLAASSGEPIGPWSARTTTAHPFQSPNFATGARPAWEYTIELCNLVGSTCWITFHYSTDDESVRETAKLFRDHLRPGIRVVVEFGNELWNPGTFPKQETWCKAGAAKDGHDSAVRYCSKRAAEVHAIFQESFGRDIVRMFAGQAANPWIAGAALDGGRVAVADAFSIAPYFGGLSRSGSLNVLDPQFWADGKPDCVAVVNHFKATSIPQVAEQIANHRAKLDELSPGRHIPLWLYEAGQHFTAADWPLRNNPKANEVYIGCNRHSAMGDAYDAYLAVPEKSAATEAWFLSDMGPYDKYGSWGQIEFLEQPRSETPKFDALMRFVERTAQRRARPRVRGWLFQ